MFIVVKRDLTNPQETITVFGPFAQWADAHGYKTKETNRWFTETKSFWGVEWLVKEVLNHEG